MHFVYLSPVDELRDDRKDKELTIYGRNKSVKAKNDKVVHTCGSLRSHKTCPHLLNKVYDGIVSLSYERWEGLESHSALAYDVKPG